MLNRLYGWYGKRVVRGVLGLIIVLIIVGIFLYKQSSNTSGTPVAEKLPEVSIESVRNLANASSFSVTGTVRALAEAELQAEAGGRVTSVRKSIGDNVRSGEIIATIESSQELAQLLQAEGAYESALASSHSNDVSLTEAKVRVRNTYRETFAATDNVLRTTIDMFYSFPGSNAIGFRLGGSGKSLEFNNARKSIEQTFTQWSEVLNTRIDSTPESELLSSSEKAVQEVNTLAVALYNEVSDISNKSNLTGEEVTAFQTNLSSARATLDATLGKISEARRSYEQAVLSSSAGTFSQSDAQVKSALGVLRNAQANYEKTIVRSPITGVINALYLTTGTYTSLGQPVVRIANNDALEISTSLGEKDLALVHIGDTVRVNDSTTGTVTRIAPAVDPATGKAEVKIGIDSATTLKNGTTASVTFTQQTETVPNTIIIPLIAIKLLPSGPVVYSVKEDNTLEAHPVVLGTITGDSVEIISGLTESSVIVRDVRGRKAGDAVTVKI